MLLLTIRRNFSTRYRTMKIGVATRIGTSFIRFPRRPYLKGNVFQIKKKNQKTRAM